MSRLLAHAEILLSSDSERDVFEIVAPAAAALEIDGR
jgi:hypothetical protein